MTCEMTAFTVAHSYPSTSCGFYAALSKGIFGCREGELTSIHRCLSKLGDFLILNPILSR